MTTTPRRSAMPLPAAVALAAAMFCGSLLMAASNAAASSIGAGYDLFHTIDPSSVTVFPSNPIPAGFFSPGSLPFDGTIVMRGVPFGPSNTDTIVQRQAGLGPIPPFNPPGGSGIVPIEIIALHLQSVQPFTVHTGSGDQLWNVDITLSGSQPIGSMNIQHSQSNGGTFSATLPVRPVLLFTPVGPGTLNTLQPNQGNLQYGSFWSHSPGVHDAHDAFYVSGNYNGGVDPTDDQTLWSFNSIGSLVDNGHGQPIPVFFNLTQQAAEIVPEPSTFALAALALAGLGLFAWRRRKVCAC